MSWVITGTQKINWDPSLITTALWLDAADASTVTTVSGAVSQWNDKSGNARHATQSTSGNRPAYQASAQNGLSAVRFTAASSHFLIAGTTSTWNFLHNGTASSVFIVTRVRSTGDNPGVEHTFLDTGGAASSSVGTWIAFNDASPANNGLSIFTSRGVNASFAVNVTTSDKLTPGSYAIIGSYIDADDPTAANRAQSRVNGDSAFGSNALTNPASTTNSTYPLNIGRWGGNDLYFTGDLCEILLLSSQPSGSDRQKVEGYLAHKWGLTANLPSDHPYKTAVPVP